MGIPIPEPSVGTLIPEIVNNFAKEDVLFAHYYNTLKLVEKMKMASYESLAIREYVMHFEEAVDQHQEFLQSNGTKMWLFNEIVLKYTSLSEIASRILVKEYVKSDLFCLLVSLILILWVCLWQINFIF
jgi:LPS O-antigen subunit length determinant protein (WzzB/FepE family)